MSLTDATPDRPDQAAVVTRVVSIFELRDRPQPPSETLRLHEAEMIADLARRAHLDGRRFVDWPRFDVGSDDPYRELLQLRAFVTARSL